MTRWIAALCCVALAAPFAYGDQVVIELTDIELDETESVSFQVKERTHVRINAVGAERKTDEVMYAYPWIICAEERTVIWTMDEEFTRPVDDSKWLREFDDEVELYPGTYNLYYHACQPFFIMGNIKFGKSGKLEDLNEELKDLLDALGVFLEDGKRHKGEAAAARELTSKLFVRVEADPQVVRVTDDPDVEREPVIALQYPDNDAYMSEGFTLTDDLELEIYAIGEYFSADESLVDWGWIIDADTRERIWRMDRSNTDWAGGADKNRRARDRQRFKAGNYVAFYVTDDSHTYDDWNASPPYDPEGWGLQVFVKDESDRSRVQPFERTREMEPVVRLIRVGDNELVSEAFRVEETTPLRVYAIGEYDRFGDRMADYAWIIRSDAKRKYWVMDYDDTEPAGGDSKNRLFDGIVNFDAGDYVVYYASDGSHSFGDGWNASPPYDQKSYGVSIYPADQASQSAIVLIDKDDLRRPDALAQITSVGDGQKRRARFSLTSPTRVSIYAIGEGTRYGMVDYGWIENESTGDIVWEMTYRKTSHAGGADKNRMVDQTILLDKGHYVVHYVTDDSHAFDDWNAPAPADPASWGIVLARQDRSGD